MTSRERPSNSAASRSRAGGEAQLPERGPSDAELAAHWSSETVDGNLGLAQLQHSLMLQQSALLQSRQSALCPLPHLFSRSDGTRSLAIAACACKFASLGRCSVRSFHCRRTSVSSYGAICQTTTHDCMRCVCHHEVRLSRKANLLPPQRLQKVVHER
jgi:hypothetical protein